MKEKDMEHTLESNLCETLNKKEQMGSINDEKDEKEEECSTRSNNTSFNNVKYTKIKEKKVLVKFLDDLKTKLDSQENEEKTFDDIYDDYLDSEYITKSHIKKN